MPVANLCSQSDPIQSIPSLADHLRSWRERVLTVTCALSGALTFYLWRNEIALCAKLLGLSASALVDNPGLILFVIAAQVRPCRHSRRFPLLSRDTA